MPTYFDYLRQHIELDVAPDPGADATAGSGPAGVDTAFDPPDLLAELASAFGATWIAPGAADELVGDPADASGSPADPWLSGNEWAGEAEIGGMSLTSGTVDPSGEGNDVFSVDGEVLDLPD